MKILVIDDNKRLLNTLSLALSTMGHEVRCTFGADTAAQHTQNEHFDFILLDYKMPSHDGIWFMRNARISKGTKVLLMTAFVSNTVIAEMFKLGVSGYLIKPFDAAELLRHLEFHSRTISAAGKTNG